MTPEAQRLYASWMGALRDAVRDGVLPSDDPSLMLLVAMFDDPQRQRTIRLAFGAGWISAMNLMKQATLDQGADADEDED